jgi:AraC family transcriptional regulator, regulatory protein of adaptative response / methylated-DNA-[protein]-cysteine methyltransferase
MLNHESCWQAVESKDRKFDGKFFFGVLTTGVYCRPSCPSRLPLRKNVRFYKTTTEAEADGLRACLRCRPLAAVGADPAAQTMRRVCRFIEQNVSERLTLSSLAAEAVMSTFHFQRSFKAVVGVTPRQYVEALRLKKLKGNLRRCKDVTEAVYDAGFESSSRVYERADTRIGMTPSQYRNGGKGVAMTYATVETAFGSMMVAATDRGISFVEFADRESELLNMLKTEYPLAELRPMVQPCHPHFSEWISALRDYLAGDQPRLSLPLDIRATVFQMRVWSYLQAIPYGAVQSYGEVAAGIGHPSAVRAVARACASNRIAILIPCHRVIRGTGELGGYKWGLARKRALLDCERNHRNRSSVHSGAAARASAGQCLAER